MGQTNNPGLPSDELNELVRRYLTKDAIRTKESEDAAGTLAGIIEAWAQKAARTTDRQLRQDFIDNAAADVLKLLDEGKYQEGAFRSWARTVLANQWINQLRQYRRYPTVSFDVADASGRHAEALNMKSKVRSPAEQIGSQEAALCELTERFHRLRDEMDALSWPAGRQTDYYAVLLLHLRFITLHRLLQSGLAAEDVPECSLADWVAARIPWEAEEGQRRLNTRLPAIASIWLFLIEDLAGASEPSRQMTVVAAINRCAASESGDDEPLTVNQWQQWLTRCRLKLRESAPRAFEEVFAAWVQPVGGAR